MTCGGQKTRREMMDSQRSHRPGIAAEPRKRQASRGVLRLHDGDRLDLRIGPVRMSLDGAELRMLAYNGSVPDASLHIDQGSDITVQVTNDGDAAATVDWHGLRLDNRHDGEGYSERQSVTRL
jgi:FtsP/CotA-like multicopper oxidase with cupredoxin domain